MTTLKPIDPDKRIEILDMIREFTFLGINFNNMLYPTFLAGVAKTLTPTFDQGYRTTMGIRGFRFHVSNTYLIIMIMLMPAKATPVNCP